MFTLQKNNTKCSWYFSALRQKLTGLIMLFSFSLNVEAGYRRSGGTASPSTNTYHLPGDITPRHRHIDDDRIHIAKL